MLNKCPCVRTRLRDITAATQSGNAAAFIEVPQLLGRVTRVHPGSSQTAHAGWFLASMTAAVLPRWVTCPGVAEAVERCLQCAWQCTEAGNRCRRYAACLSWGRARLAPVTPPRRCIVHSATPTTPYLRPEPPAPPNNPPIRLPSQAATTAHKP